MLDEEAAISYFGYTYFFSRSDVLSSVPIYNDAVNGYVAPNSASISAGTYTPFSRPIYMNLLTREESLDDTASFVEFGLSRFGENLVEQTGYAPFPRVCRRLKSTASTRTLTAAEIAETMVCLPVRLLALSLLPLSWCWRASALFSKAVEAGLVRRLSKRVLMLTRRTNWKFRKMLRRPNVPGPIQVLCIIDDIYILH